MNEVVNMWFLSSFSYQTWNFKMVTECQNNGKTMSIVPGTKEIPEFWLRLLSILCFVNKIRISSIHLSWLACHDSAS